MFIHHGKRRTAAHNIRIGSLLSFVAGMVNVAGFLAVAKLTTNVTGHFAFFVDEVYQLRFLQGLIYFSYILFFFLGSFLSGLLVEAVLRSRNRWGFIIPVLIEAAILASVALFSREFAASHPNLLACSLLFAMGLQNSLVTRISGAVVRTTHLTGLFTDMGIELSQLFFRPEPDRRKHLLFLIRLRLVIIGFFFLGGIASGIMYARIGPGVLGIAAAVLMTGILSDIFRIAFLRRFRRIRPK